MEPVKNISRDEGKRILETNSETKDTIFNLTNFRFFILFFFNAGFESASFIIYQYIYSIEKHRYDSTLDIPLSNISDLNLTYCNLSTNYTAMDIRENVHAHASTWLFHFNLASGIPAVFVTIVFGAISDCIGRKFMFFLAIVGVLIKASVFTIIIYFNLDLSYGYIGYIIEGFSGSGYLILLASFSYTADVTSSGQKRIFGIVLIEFVNTISNGVINLGIGQIIEGYGFLIPLLICGGSLAMATLFLIFLPETVQKPDLSRDQLQNGVRHMVTLYTSDTIVKRRSKLVILLVTFFLTLQSFLGTSGISVIFKMDEPFCMTSSELGYISALETVAAQIIGVPLIKLQQRFLSAPLIAIIGCVFEMAGNIITGLATKKLLIYISKYYFIDFL